MNKKIYAILGLSDFKTYILKYFMPIFALDFMILFLFLFGFDNPMSQWLGIFVFFGVLLVLFGYPTMLVDSQSRDIEQNLHYFITYAGAISTVNLERKELFKDLSNKKRYAEISNVFKKLLYLVESIKVDFSTSAYKTAALLKTEHFSRFLERMGIALSFNADVGKFFLDEQRVLMDAYRNVYEEGLERIRLVEDMFVSLVLAFAFILATVMLIPFLTGINSTLFLQFGIVAITMLDIILYIFVRFFLPQDRVYHDLGYDEGRKKVLMIFGGSVFFCLFMIPFIIFLNLSIMIKIAFILTPLIITGMYANYQERLVWKRDTIFPAFIRSLGDVHQSKGGTLTTTVETLMPHNFGILNEMLEKVYKRLKITSDKFASWYYFSKESGSALIAEFTDIFISVVYRGGSASVAGNIVSDNMTRINGLREHRKGFAATLKGNVYGTFFGLALTLYISVLVSVLLFRIFASLTEGLEGFALNTVSSIFPTEITDTFDSSMLYIAIILTIHAIISAFIIKEVDGGSKFSMLSDLVIMLWIGALMEVIITATFMGMFSSYFGS